MLKSSKAYRDSKIINLMATNMLKGEVNVSGAVNEIRIHCKSLKKSLAVDLNMRNSALYIEIEMLRDLLNSGRCDLEYKEHIWVFSSSIFKQIEAIYNEEKRAAVS